MRILSLSVLISLYYLTFKGLRIDEICHAFLIPDNFLSVFDIDAFGLYVVWQRYTLEGVTAVPSVGMLAALPSATFR